MSAIVVPFVPSRVEVYFCCMYMSSATHLFFFFVLALWVHSVDTWHTLARMEIFDWQWLITQYGNLHQLLNCKGSQINEAFSDTSYIHPPEPCQYPTLNPKNFVLGSLTLNKNNLYLGSWIEVVLGLEQDLCPPSLPQWSLCSYTTSSCSRVVISLNMFMVPVWEPFPV